MVARWEVLDDRGMIGLRSEHARLDVKTSGSAEEPRGHRDSLSRATETLMQTAAVVRRSAGQPQAASELSQTLAHVEDLSTICRRASYGLRGRSATRTQGQEVSLGACTPFITRFTRRATCAPEPDAPLPARMNAVLGPGVRHERAPQEREQVRVAAAPGSLRSAVGGDAFE